jgi:glycosyltransferase involved in cell wall biosynthesis
MEYYNVSILERKMAVRVCQICAVDFTVEKFLTPLIDGMSAEGWEVVTVCSDGKLVTNLKKRGYSIHTIPIARSMNPFKAIRSIILLFYYFKKQKFNVIHVHTPVASLLARVAAKYSCKSYVVYTAHGFYFHDNMNVIKKHIFITLEKIAGRLTNLLFCQSQEDAIDAAKYRIMDKNNIITIGNGVDVSKYDNAIYLPQFSSIRSELNIPLDAKVIGIVARMVKEKGYNELLQSAITLCQNHSDLYFLLIGGKLESDHDKGIEKILEIAKHKLGSRLIDLGLRNDVAPLISIMDIFCLPSYREGLPRTIIEAMFLKKPVVATDIRGCREEVIHNKTGLLVPVKNHEALTTAFDYLLNNLDIAKRMGENGNYIAQQLYNEESIVQLQIKNIKDRLLF